MIKYPTYKPSGIPWLGDVPDHWEILRLGSKFIERKEKVSDKDFSPLSVTKKGILPQLKNAAKTNDGDNRKRVNNGDFVINSRSDRKGSSGLSNLTGSVSLINIVIEPKNYCGNFAHVLLKSIPFQEEFYRYGSGIVADLWSTQYADMRKIMIPVPTLSEQIQIARFLDWKMGQINKFIKAKKRIIELLKEQKQAIINDAVTGKIDVRTGKPYPKYKPSGIAWLGDVPEEWEVRRLKNLVNNINVQVDTKDNDELYIALENVVSWTGEIKINNDDIIFESKVKKYQIGDILFGKLRPYLAKVTIPTIKGVCVGEFLVLRTSDNFVYNEFMKFKLLTKSIIDLINSSAYGSKMPRASWDFIGNVIISYPILERQKLIVAYIQEKTNSIDLTISRIEKELELILEYKNRLIADVVTGKVDVRGIEVGVELALPDEDVEENEEIEEIHEIDQ